MIKYPHIKACLKHGKDYYKIYNEKDELVTGLFNKGQAIIIVMEIERLLDVEPRSYKEIEITVWDYSNGKQSVT